MLAMAFRNKVRAGDLMGVKAMLKDGGVDFAAAGQTEREWTPLHTACWGTAKPQYDREIVEAILAAAMKGGKAKEEAVRGAKDAKDGSTPLDLATERRNSLVVGGSSEDAAALDEKSRAGWTRGRV